LEIGVQALDDLITLLFELNQTLDFV